MPGMDFFTKNKSATKPTEDSTAAKDKTPTQVTSTATKDDSTRDFSLDTLREGAPSVDTPVETVKINTPEFSMDSLRSLLNRSVADIEDMSGLQTLPPEDSVLTPPKTIDGRPIKSETEILGTVEEVSLEELLGIKINVDKPAITEYDTTSIVDMSENQNEELDGSADSNQMEGSPVEIITEEPPAEVASEEANIKADEHIKGIPPDTIHKPVTASEVQSKEEVEEKQTKEEPPVKEPLTVNDAKQKVVPEESDIVREAAPITESALKDKLQGSSTAEEIKDEQQNIPIENTEQQTESTASIDQHTSTEEIPDGEYFTSDNLDEDSQYQEADEDLTQSVEVREEVPSSEDSFIEPTETESEQIPSEDTENTAAKDSRVASLEQEVIRLRKSVEQLTKQLQTGAVAAVTTNTQTGSEEQSEQPSSEQEKSAIVTPSSDVIKTDTSCDTASTVDDTEDVESEYFPFIGEVHESFAESIDRLKHLQQILDRDMDRSEDSRLRKFITNRFFTAREKDYTKEVSNITNPMQVDTIVADELLLYEDTEIDLDEQVEITYTYASALFGAWLLNAVAEISGCTDVDFGVDEDDADGNIIVIFDDFDMVFAGFKDEDSAANFCTFLKSYTACHVSEISAEERSNTYHPFKKGMRGKAFKLLDASQMYQAYEDYKSELHGLRALLSPFSGEEQMQGFNQYSGGQYHGGYGGQYGGYGGQYGGSYSQYNSPYGGQYSNQYGAMSGSRRGGLFGSIRQNMGGRSPYGSTAFGRQDPMERGRGLRRFFGPKVDRFGRPKKSLKRRLDDSIELGLENKINCCKDVIVLDKVVMSLDRRVKNRIRRKISSGRWYADYHVMGLGAIAAYKTLQLTLDKNSGVRDILVGQVQGGRGGPTVEFVDFCDLRLTFVSATAADAFVDYISNQFNVVRVS